MTAEELIEAFRSTGYSISLNGGDIEYEYTAKGSPDKDKAKPLLEAIRRRKTEVIDYLRDTSPKPYLDDGGELQIPFDCEQRYHWWSGGQSVKETLEELMNTDHNRN